MTWEWRMKCTECGEPGIRSLRRTTQEEKKRAEDDPTILYMCQCCGSTRWDGPLRMSSRPISVWWKPWTWGKTEVVWRPAVDDEGEE